MGHLNWTSESIRWLSDIFEYISAENPIAAEAVVSGIYQRAQVLLSHPEIGHRYRPSKRHLRILMYGHYRIAYLIKSDSDIDILGVFHASRYQPVFAVNTYNNPLNADAHFVGAG